MPAGGGMEIFMNNENLCKQCGRPVNSNDNFCGVCGTSLQENTVPQQLSELNQLRDFIIKYKMYLIIVACLVVAIFTVSIVIENQKKNFGYKDCIEEHIREFEMKKDCTVYYDTIYYSDAFLEDYSLAIEANVTYEQANIDGECNLKVIAAYDESTKEWFIYNGISTIPVAKPATINSDIWGD